MDPRRGILRALIVGGLALSGGCAARNEPAPSATRPPVEDELPQSRLTERTTAVNVGVEQRGVRPALATVPEFQPVEPTPEERRILGEPPPDPIDQMMVFYPPARGSRDGVSPLTERSAFGVDISRHGTKYGVYSAPGSLAGIDVTYHPLHGVLLRPGYIGAASGQYRHPAGQPYLESTYTVGENTARTGAARQKRLYD